MVWWPYGLGLRPVVQNGANIIIIIIKSLIIINSFYYV